MNNNAPSGTVTVTGGSGFLASWIIVELLRAGYNVRTTVRNRSREAQARSAISNAVDAGDRLTFVEADLMADTGWAEALRGSRYLIHPASPMQLGEYAKTDVIRPAREGTLRVLEAALAAGVKHTVVTSSVEACRPVQPDQLGSSDIWTDVEGKRVSDYVRAKTLAERDLWAWAQQHPSFAVTTVLPGFIQGPVLGADFSGSVELIAMLLRGKMAMAPRLGFSIIDVRDLAAVHVKAMTNPAAAGKRLVAAGDFLWVKEVADILRAEFPDRADKLPRKNAPDLLIRAAALFNPEMRQMTSNLGKRVEFDSSLVQSLLDWRARPSHDAVVDGAQSLISFGLA